MLLLKGDLISQDEIIPTCIFRGGSFDPIVMSISGFLLWFSTTKQRSTSGGATWRNLGSITLQDC